MSKPLILVFGDQLSLALPTLCQAPDNAIVALCEVADEASYVPHHIHKIGLFLAAMRHFAQQLREAGWQVHHSALDDPDNTHSLIDEAERLALAYHCDHILVVRPGEWRLWEAMQSRANGAIPWQLVEDDRFFTTPDDFAQWAQGRKQLRLEYFYREQRKRSGLLMDADKKPVGGQWNFDHDNREPLPDNFAPPQQRQHEIDDITQEALDVAARHFPEHIGRIDNFNWPVTRQQALTELDDFIAYRLSDFGRYQDAISDAEPYLFHSRVSVALNIGLLSPREVCHAVEQAYLEGQAPINAAEGFIRQVLGWREYVRGLYWTQMPEYKTRNGLGFQRELPAFFWDGKTDMRCLKRAIEMTIDNSYAHHIQRLMVTGNFALLLGVVPEQVCEWYLAVYADAFDWVELPNTLGMVMHADGGLLGSKPYAASGKYIDRMSDYCAACRYKVKETTGESACPFNALYWDFLMRHRERFESNPRMKMMYRHVDRMSGERRRAVEARAESVKRRVDEL